MVLSRERSYSWTIFLMSRMPSQLRSCSVLSRVHRSPPAETPDSETDMPPAKAQPDHRTPRGDEYPRALLLNRVRADPASHIGKGGRSRRTLLLRGAMADRLKS